MAKTPEEIKDAITEAATGPKSVAVDSQSVTSRDIDDLITGYNFTNEEPAKKPHFGLRFTKLSPPGGG